MRSHHPPRCRRPHGGASAVAYSLAIAAVLAWSLHASAALAQSCATTTRTPFAGHAFPANGGLVDEQLVLVPAFPDLPPADLVKPLFLTAPQDGTNRIFVVDNTGYVRVFPNDPAVTSSNLFLDVTSKVDTSKKEDGLLGLAFHPDYATNGYFYVRYTADASACTNPLFGGCSRIVRYQVDATDPNAANPASEYVVLEWDRWQDYHNGGMLAFGPDGYLYASVGDQTDRILAQDTSEIPGSLLRMDVDSGVEYAPGIPAGNPFGNTVFHYGLRNPWRFAFDRAPPHDLLIADVGEASLEEVNVVPYGTPGGVNFGWPWCEGTADGPQGSCDPAMTLPDLQYAHRSSPTWCSITGGYVYRGSITALYGQYIYADYCAGEVMGWDRTTREPAAPFLAIPQQLITSSHLVTSFGEDEQGELYLLTYGSEQIYKIEASTGPGGDAFPELLSATGLFTSTVPLTPAPGLIEYSVNSPLYSDGAGKTRFIALPGTEKIGFTAEGEWTFPVGTVFVKHFSVPGSTRPLETRVYYRQASGYLGFTYVWNPAETDAQLLRTDLVEDITLDGGGTQTWHFPSPGACDFCHTPAAGYVLGARTRQLNGPLDPAVGGNQLFDWNCIGLFDTDIGAPGQFARHAALDDGAASRPTRARSYLASNCSMCHQPNSSAPSDQDFRPLTLLGDMGAIGEAPGYGDLGLVAPEVIAAGDPAASVLWHRMASLDPAERMARGTRIPDAEAVTLLGDWIEFDLWDAVNSVPFLDSDEDGIDDAQDNCPTVQNAGQLDTGGGPEGDACDPTLMPDLIATPDPPAVVLLYGSTPLGVTATNIGVGTATGAAQMTFRLSLDATLDPADVLIGDCFVPSLPGSGSDACADPNGTVPAGFATIGPSNSLAVHLFACSDALGLIAEADEGNNCASAPTLLVPEPGAALQWATGLLSLYMLRPGRARRGSQTDVRA